MKKGENNEALFEKRTLMKQKRRTILVMYF